MLANPPSRLGVRPFDVRSKLSREINPARYTRFLRELSPRCRIRKFCRLANDPGSSSFMLLWFKYRCSRHFRFSSPSTCTMKRYPCQIIGQGLVRLFCRIQSLSTFKVVHWDVFWEFTKLILAKCCTLLNYPFQICSSSEPSEHHHLKLKVDTAFCFNPIEFWKSLCKTWVRLYSFEPRKESSHLSDFVVLKREMLEHWKTR